MLNNTNRRAVSLRQLSFLFSYSDVTWHIRSVYQYAQNCETDFRNFELEIFGDFFLILNLDLVLVTAGAEQSGTIKSHSIPKCASNGLRSNKDCSETAVCSLSLRMKTLSRQYKKPS